MKTILQPNEKKIIAVCTAVFILWSAVFIYRTSFVAIDGQRYFCLFDDAMVSMRYAWNFSHGEGLVWNPGERIQGYTNLLMTLVMALGTLLFDKSLAVLWIQVLGVGIMLAIAAASLRIGDHFARDGSGTLQPVSSRVLAFIFALSYYPLAYWSLMGMETGLLTLLLLLGVLSAFEFERKSNPAHLYLASVYLGLAFLTRNDSLIFSVLIWVYILRSSPALAVKEAGFYPSRKFPKSLLSELPAGSKNSRVLLHFSSALVLYVLFVIGQFRFQYTYYGEVLPNTYILKLTGMPLMDRLANGFGFILPFLLQTGFLLLPVTVNTFLRFRKRKLLLLSLVLASIGYQVYVGGDPWHYWRMMAPTVPLLGILFILTIFESLHTQTTTSAGGLRFWKADNPAVQASLLLALGVLVANSYFLPEIVFLERPFYVSANQHNVNIAVALSQVTRPEASTGIFWAGAIPYFSERQAIDFLGKSDRYIASLAPDLSGTLSVNGMKSPPGHNKYDLEYSIQLLRPTYVQDFEWGTQDLSAWARAYYVEVTYKGVLLDLLIDSPDVLWEKIEQP